MDCVQLDTPETGQFYARLQAVQAQRRLPLSGSLELTFRCNLRCAHCYVGEARRGSPHPAEMSTLEIQRLLDELAEAGCLWLLLTGGEPLLRPDFLEIYRYARRKGFVVSVFTNGTLLTAAIADALAEFPPLMTEISLYGHTQAAYERVTGVPGSHAHCRRGIDLLLERGLKLKLKTIVMRLNIQELPAMREFASGLGVDFRYDPMIVGGLDGGKTPAGVRLSPQELVQVDLNDPDRVQAYRENHARLGAGRPDPGRLYTCLAGVNAFHIDPFGKLSPCMLSRSQNYDLRRGSFAEGWNRFLPRVTAQPRSMPSPCQACGLLAICGQCPGWAALEHGDAQRKVDYLCQVAHLRAKTFGLSE